LRRQGSQALRGGGLLALEAGDAQERAEGEGLRGPREPSAQAGELRRAQGEAGEVLGCWRRGGLRGRRGRRAEGV